MRPTILLLFLGSMLYFTSCATTTRGNRSFVYLTDNSRFVLLPSSEIEKSMDMAQHISAAYGDQDFFMNAWVKADITGIEMILINELGVNMGELFYRDGSVSFSSPVFPVSIRPEYIIADFQLCFYNPIMLGRALEEIGLNLVIQDNTRRIFKGNDLIIEIIKTNPSILFINHLRGYIYTLEGDFE